MDRGMWNASPLMAAMRVLLLPPLVKARIDENQNGSYPFPLENQEINSESLSEFSGLFHSSRGMPYHLWQTGVHSSSLVTHLRPTPALGGVLVTRTNPTQEKADESTNSSTARQGSYSSQTVRLK